MKGHVERAKLEVQTNTEVTYLLPIEDVTLFPELFMALDNNKDNLGILNYGSTTTSMEEVNL